MFLVIWGMLTMFLFRELTTNLAPGLHWVNADLLNQRHDSGIKTLCFNHSGQIDRAHLSLLLTLSQFAIDTHIKDSD